MIGQKEIPGYTLPDMSTMRLFGGYISGNFRFRTYVPTTIFDPKIAVVMVYRLEPESEQFPDIPEELVAQKLVHLKSMPYWNQGAQAIFLVKEDLKKLIKASENLEEKLRDK